MSAVRSRQHPPDVRTRARTAYAGVVVQLVRIPACHAGGRGFESRPLRQFEGRTRVRPFRIRAADGRSRRAAVRHAPRGSRRRKDRSGDVRSRAQAQTDRAVHSCADHGSVRVLRRRLLLPRSGRRRRGREVRRRHDHRSGIRATRSATSRSMLRRNAQGVDPAIFDNPEVRFNLVQQLLRERLVEKKGADLHFRVSNAAGLRADRRGSRAFAKATSSRSTSTSSCCARPGIAEPAFEDGIRRQLLAETRRRSHRARRDRPAGVRPSPS